MITLNQLIRGKNGRRPEKKKTNRLFGDAPFRSAICTLIKTMSPKKPNSAKRKVAQVQFRWNKAKAFVYIPTQGPHEIQVHSKVLVKQGSPADLPGVHGRLVKGWGDFKHKKQAVKK